MTLLHTLHAHTSWLTKWILVYIRKNIRPTRKKTTWLNFRTKPILQMAIKQIFDNNWTMWRRGGMISPLKRWTLNKCTGQFPHDVVCLFLWLSCWVWSETHSHIGRASAGGVIACIRSLWKSRLKVSLFYPYVALRRPSINKGLPFYFCTFPCGLKKHPIF